MDALARAADDVGDDVAPLVVLGLLGRDPAGVDQGLDERVVVRDLLERAVVEEVGRESPAWAMNRSVPTL